MLKPTSTLETTNLVRLTHEFFRGTAEIKNITK